MALGISIGEKGFDFCLCAIKILGGVARDGPDYTMFGLDMQLWHWLWEEVAQTSVVCSSF